MRASSIIFSAQPGFFLDLARHAARDIDQPLAQVIEVRRAGWKIDSAGIRRVARHLAEHERAVAAAQCAHAKSVKHALAGKTQIAPGQKTCEIGLEILGAE